MINSVAIVTGASQGIGRATAIRLALDFDAVVIVARNLEKLERTAVSIRAQGSECLAITADIVDVNSPVKIVQRTIAAYGRIDSLVNIAGSVPQIDLFEMTDIEWNDGMELKLHGARRMTLAAWPELKKRGGSVVMISGNSALTPKASSGAVGVVNAAIVALAKAFADRGLVDGIQVNSVLPGAVLTDRRRSFLVRYAKTLGMSVEEAARHFLHEAGISRYGEPEDIANLMAFLVSPGSRWMTGAALRVDGGEVKCL